MIPMRAIHEHEGIMLEIEYSEPDNVELGPILHGVRVLDRDYKATGPCLMPLLSGMFLLTGKGEGTMFFSKIADELIA